MHTYTHTQTHAHTHTHAHKGMHTCVHTHIHTHTHTHTHRHTHSCTDARMHTHTSNPRVSLCFCYLSALIGPEPCLSCCYLLTSTSWPWQPQPLEVKRMPLHASCNDSNCEEPISCDHLPCRLTSLNGKLTCIEITARFLPCIT